METISQKIKEQAKKEGKLKPPFLQLGEQMVDEKGKSKGVKSTGQHIVKFLGDKEAMGTDPITGEKREEVHYLFEENGEPKRYYTSKYSKKDKVYTDELSYFILRMAEFDYGDTISLEMKKSKLKNYVDIQKVGSEEQDDDIPIIEENDITALNREVEGEE